MSNRFHNKFHRHNHHTRETARDTAYPDSAYDPIASPEAPFQGEFYVDGNITTLSGISALGGIFATDGTFHGNITIEGNLSVLGDTTQVDTIVQVTSALEVINVGTGPALKVTQTGSEPIAHFIDSNGDDIIFADNGYVGLGTTLPEEKLTIIGNSKVSGNSITLGNAYLSGNEYVDGNLVVGPTVLYVDVASQSVGVGVTPNEKLTVYGNISASGDAIIASNLYLSGNAVVNSNVYVDEETFVVDSLNRNVGIGTVNPSEKLTVIGNGRFTGNLITDGNIYLSGGETIDGNLVVDGNLLYVDSTNNKIGVGTTNPNEILTVQGNISATGTSTFDGNVVTSSLLDSQDVFVNRNFTVSVDSGTVNPQIYVKEGEHLVGIGTNIPNEMLTVAGNISSTGNFYNTGNAIIDGTTTIETLNIGLVDQVVVQEDNTLKTRTINSQVWDTGAEFLSSQGLTVNYVPRYAGINTLVDSSIEYNDVKTIINGDVTITGRLTSIGDAFFSNTIFATTSALSVINNGPGPALYVYQAAGSWDVASFYDGDGIEVLHVGNSQPSGLGRVGINTGDPNKELTVIGSISATDYLYATDLILSGVSVNDTIVTTAPVTADLTVGSIDAGDVVPVGTSLQEFIEQLIIKTFYPTYVAPSTTLTSNLASIVESGTTGITLTVDLNKGSIVGKSVGGIWQPSLFQDYRSGSATNYIINGDDNGVTNSKTFSMIAIQDGVNTFDSITTYGEGPQPVDSKGFNYETALATGALSATVNVTGARKAFYGVDSTGTTSASIRSLGSSTAPNVAKGATFSINIPAGTTSIVFAYPISLGDVTSVKYVEGLNAEVKNNFIQTVVSVEGANNYTAIDYYVYRYAPTGYGGVSQPFSSAVTYTVTI